MRGSSLEKYANRKADFYWALVIGHNPWVLENISHLEVAHFLRLLLRHRSGAIILLWDGGSIHQAEAVRAVLTRRPRLHVERFPAYAPELNPDEQVWGHLKGRLANGRPDTAEELLADLSRVTRRLRRRPQILRSFILASDLPPLFSS